MEQYSLPGIPSANIEKIEQLINQMAKEAESYKTLPTILEEILQLATDRSQPETNMEKIRSLLEPFKKNRIH